MPGYSQTGAAWRAALEAPAGAGPPVVARRRFLGLAGIFALSVAAASGCTGRGRAHPGRPPVTEMSGVTTSTAPAVVLDPGHAVDVEILRTASSIEHYAVGVYTEAAGLDVVTSPGILAALKYFADQHSEHASAFEQATRRAGGKPFTEPNRVLSRTAATTLARLATEQDAVSFAYGVERLAAATYLSSVGGFINASLNAMVMGVGAVECRHQAVLGMFLSGVMPTSGAPSPPYPAGGFEASAGGLTAGVGL